MGITDVSSMLTIIIPVIATRPKVLLFENLVRSAPLTIVSQITSSWSVALTKTSIALLLMRLQQARGQQVRGWTIFLYAIISVQIGAAIFLTILHTTRCIPLEGIWRPGVQARCWSPRAFKLIITHASSMVVATDVVFALIPLTFLHHIRSTLLHRVVIAVLMSLGLLASSASVVKTVLTHRFDETADASAKGLEIAIWASVEAQAGIIAACIPCLRAPFMRLLERIGLRRPHNGDDVAWSIREMPLSRVGYAASTSTSRRGVDDGAATPDTARDLQLDSTARGTPETASCKDMQIRG